MAGIAVEEDQLGKHAIAAPLRITEELEQLERGEHLAKRPGAHALRDGVAAGAARRGVVRRLDMHEGVDLERQARMPGGHHAMGDQLLRIAEMAAEAQARALEGFPHGVHPERH